MIIIYDKVGSTFTGYSDLGVASIESGLRVDVLKGLEGLLEVGDLVVGELEIVKSRRGGLRQ